MENNYPWLDPSLPSQERARLLAAAMTPAEQAGQLLNYDGGKSIDWLVENHVGSFLNRKGAKLAELAREMRSQHRLKVPVLFALDCIHGHGLAEDLDATIFPSPLAMAATFDPEQARTMGRVTADEMVATGIRWNYAPNLDVARDLRFGRIEETFGEDPFLVGEIGAACIEGMQGDPEHPRVIATAKHFVGYSEGVGARDSAESPVSFRVLRRDHFPPHRRAIRAGVRSVMSGYHAVDGTPCVLHRRLLRDELRTHLGFTGFVVSDANNVGWCDLLQAITGTREELVVRAVEAGNEVHLAAPGTVEALVAAVESGRLDPTVLRDAAALFLEAKFALGLFEESDPTPLKNVRTAESFRSSVDAAAASMVLLENRGVLPLSSASKRIVVVGELADDLRQQLGCWTLLCRNDKADQELAKQPDSSTWSYLAALRRRASAAGCELVYAPGCGPVSNADSDATRITCAVDAAYEADVIIAIVGDSDHWAGEGRDRASLDLPGHQQKMLEALHATGKPLVVVLAVTKPQTVPWIKENAPAVICAWSSGMGGGAALAELLFGDRDFTGRTPVTWPAHVGQMPVTYDRIPGAHFEGFSGGPNNSVPNAPRDPSRDLNIWRIENTRHIDMPAEWVHGLWPFGHGLSYSSVTLVSASMMQLEWKIGESPRVRVELSNTNNRPALAVVQIYVRDVAASVTRPDRRLAAWARIVVDANASAIAEISIAPEVLEIIDADENRVTEPGTFHALVGFSSLITELKILPFEVVAS